MSTTIRQDVALRTRPKMQIFPWENKFEKILEMKFTYNILFIYLYLLDKQCKVVNLNQNHRILYCVNNRITIFFEKCYLKSKY